MEKLAHLWNVSQFMANLKCEQTWSLQAHYIKCCKNLEREVELPKQKFGPLSMCSHCGVLWQSMDYKVHILKGRRPSKRMRKLIKNSSENLPKVRSSLVEKCKKNEMNKLVRKCSSCLKNTEIPMEKPERKRIINSNSLNSIAKKKKKNKKDKTAGLNLSGISTLKVIHKAESDIQSVQNTLSAQKSSVQTPKPKKLNINYLKNVITKGKTPQKRKSLHNFLTELY